MTKKPTPKKKPQAKDAASESRGGAPVGNQNAAKPPDQRGVPVYAYLRNPAQKAKFVELGGSGWLQGVIDRAKVRA